MISKAEAVEIWGPNHPRIAAVIKKAWDEWKSIRSFRSENGLGPVLYQRTISNEIFDGIARYARSEFGTDDAFLMCIEPQTFKLIHKGCVGRFKKAGDDLLGQNQPTQAAMDFVNADGLLPDFPAATGKIEFVWTANELFTELESIHMIGRDGDTLIWEHEIDWKSDAATVVPMPTTPDEPDDDTDLLVTPKRRPDVETDEG